MGKKKVVVFFLFLAAAGAGVYYYKNTASHTTGNKKPPTFVKAISVAQKNIPLELTAVGTVMPYKSVTIHSRIDSQIVEVKFNAGDYVKQGDFLFQLDDRTLKAQIEEQKANLARDHAQEESLQLQYNRKKKLADKGYDTQGNLETAKAAYMAQRATAAATAAMLQNLMVQLQYTQITAPIDGRTGTIHLTAGNNVKANDTQALVTINQVKPIWAQISFPQHYLDTLHQAKTQGVVSATAQHENSKQVSGRLDYIDNAVDATTGTFAARALFDNNDETLWPGMFVTVTLKVGEAKNALSLPEVAIQHGKNEDFVFVIHQSKAERRSVKTGHIQNGEAIIDSGLTAGEQVAIDGMMRLEDGGEVAIAPAASVPAEAGGKP